MVEILFEICANKHKVSYRRDRKDRTLKKILKNVRNDIQHGSYANYFGTPGGGKLCGGTEVILTVEEETP